MARPDRETANAWYGRQLVDHAGETVGTVDDIFLDKATGEPAWALVTGAAGTAPSFVPLVDADEEAEVIRVRFSRALVAGAPAVAGGEELSPVDEELLAAHYDLPYPGVALGAESEVPAPIPSLAEQEPAMPYQSAPPEEPVTRSFTPWDREPSVLGTSPADVPANGDRESPSPAWEPTSFESPAASGKAAGRAAIGAALATGAAVLSAIAWARNRDRGLKPVLVALDSAQRQAKTGAAAAAATLSAAQQGVKLGLSAAQQTVKVGLATAQQGTKAGVGIAKRGAKQGTAVAKVSTALGLGAGKQAARGGALARLAAVGDKRAAGGRKRAARTGVLGAKLGAGAATLPAKRRALGTRVGLGAVRIVGKAGIKAARRSTWFGRLGTRMGLWAVRRSARAGVSGLSTTFELGAGLLRKALSAPPQAVAGSGRKARKAAQLRTQALADSGRAVIRRRRRRRRLRRLGTLAGVVAGYGYGKWRDAQAPGASAGGPSRILLPGTSEPQPPGTSVIVPSAEPGTQEPMVLPSSALEGPSTSS